MALAFIAYFSSAEVAAGTAFTETFESLNLGQLDGQGGWHGWDANNTPFANVVNTQNHTAGGSQAVELAAGADSVTEITYTSGRWRITAWTFVPASFIGKTYFIVLNTYNDLGPYEWAVQVGFNGDTGLVECDCGSPTPALAMLVRNTWADLVVDVDFATGITDVYYHTASNPSPIATYLWANGVFGNDAFATLAIDAIDLVPDAIGFPHVTPMFFDDITIERAGAGPCPSTIAGDRPDIHSFTPAQRADLVARMQDYIDLAVVQKHLDPPHDKHGSARFLPWHRDYIKGMEDYLISQSRPEFVPLPRWEPSTPIPTEFDVVDPDCQHCGPLSDLTPDVALPDTLCAGLCDQVPFGSFRPLLEGWHGGVHGAVGGVMGGYRSPEAPIFWLWHAFIDDLWFVWQCTCGHDEGGAFDGYSPAEQITNLDAGIADAWIQDSPEDLAEEPNFETLYLWESSDIWVRNDPAVPVGPTRFLNEHEHENPVYTGDPTDQPYIYVKVRNRGCTTISGQLHVYWANASVGLTWPIHFTEVSTSPVPLNAIGAGREHVAEFQWANIPQPTPQTGDHFCLVARFVANPRSADPIQGEGSNVSILPNVRNSNQIAWKNLTIIDAGSDDTAGFLVRNISPGVGFLALQVTHPPEEAGDSYFDHGPVRIDLGPTLYARWIANGAMGTGIQTAPEANTLFILQDGASIDGLPIAFDEEFLVAIRTGPLTAGATPCEGDRTVFHLRVSAFAGGMLVGGNTYRVLPESILPSPEVVVEPLDPLVDCTATGVRLLVSSTVPVGATVQWFRDGMSIPGATSTLHLATVSGDYSALVSYSNGCERTSRSIDVHVSSRPVNDEPVNATQIGLSVHAPYDVHCATNQPNEATPGAGSGIFGGCRSSDGWCAADTSAQNSVWFVFTAPVGGMVDIHVDASHELDHEHLADTQMAVWEVLDPQDFGTFSLVAANDDSGDHGAWGLAPALHDLGGLVPGNDYYIQIDGKLGTGGKGLLLVEPPSPGTAVCFGDGSGAACGCANESHPGTGGCRNSVSGTQGSLGSASGTAGQDQTSNPLTFAFTNVRTQPGLFFQANNTIGGGAGSTFGDGIRCCGGGLVRVETINPPVGPEPVTVTTTATLTPAPPGTKRCYQYWYRDPGGPCGQNFNLSSAVTVTWGP